MNVPEQKTGDQATTHSWSLGDRLKALPRQYSDAYIHPSVATFAEAIRKADWVVNVIEILLYTIVITLLQNLFIRWFQHLAIPLSNTDLLGSANNLLSLVLPIGAIWGFVLLFGGTGSVTEHCHALLLIVIPFGLFYLFLNQFISISPTLVFLITILIGTYCIVLQVLAVMAVHKLNTGKAIASVLIGDLIGTGVAYAIFSITGHFLFGF